MFEFVRSATTTPSSGDQRNQENTLINAACSRLTTSRSVASLSLLVSYREGRNRAEPSSVTVMADDFKFNTIAEANIKFVLEVEKYPCLYDSTLHEYADKDATERAWNAIAKTTNNTANHCKVKWANLRSTFVRRRRRIRAGELIPTKGYYLDRYMDFIVPFIKPSRKSSSSTLPVEVNIEFEDNSQPSEEESQDPSLIEILDIHSYPKTLPKLTPKNKNRNDFDQHFQKNESIVAECPRRSYLLSLLPEVNELTESQFRAFKRRSLALLDEIAIEESTVTIEVPTSHTPKKIRIPRLPPKSSSVPRLPPNRTPQSPSST